MAGKSQTDTAGKGTAVVTSTLPYQTGEIALPAGSMSEFYRARHVALANVYGQVSPHDRCLVVPMGGGGDCMGASLVMYDLMRNLGAEVAMLGLTLKRPSQTNTTKPLGCLPLTEFTDLEHGGELAQLVQKLNLSSLGFVSSDTVGPHGLLVDEVRLLRHCASHPHWRNHVPTIGLLDPSAGIGSVANDLGKLLRAGHFKHVYFVDVGGDVVTEGAEEDKKTLWSPVLDEMMNFVAARLEGHFPTRTLVAGLGGDGEITHERFIQQHDIIAKRGGFHGAVAFPPDAVGWYRELLRDAATETSRQILVALDQIVADDDRFGQFVSVQRHINALAEGSHPKVELSDLFLFDIPVSLRGGTRTSALNVLTPYVMSYKPGVIAQSNKFAWLARADNLPFKGVVEQMRKEGFRTELDNAV